MVAAPPGCPRNGVDADLRSVYLAVRLGRGTKNTVSAEIEIKEIGRGVDGAQCPVYLEVIAGETLDKPPREHNLKHVAPQTVLHPGTHMLFELFVGDGAVFLSFGKKVVGGKVTLVDQRLHLHQVTYLILTLQLNQADLVGEVIEHQQVFIKDIKQVGGIVAFLPAFADGNVLGILYTVESGVPEQSALFQLTAGNLEPANETV